jgi:hypothetical protein
MKLSKPDEQLPDILAQYQTGVWIALLVAAAAIFGLILWLGYMVFL